MGPYFQADVVRAAILIRINMLLKGFSGVKLTELECYRVLLNGGITPVVAQYGGLAAEIAVSRNDRPKYRSDPPRPDQLIGLNFINYEPLKTPLSSPYSRDVVCGSGHHRHRAGASAGRPAEAS